MMTVEAKLLAAKTPEDLFGDLPNDESSVRAVRREYKRLALLVHPDVSNGDTKLAFEALQRLTDAAVKAIVRGQYGQRSTVMSPILITTRRHTYKATELVARGEVANVYAATYGEDSTPAVIKVVRDPTKGRLLAHEASVLKDLLSTTGEMFDLISLWLPGYMEAFGYRRGSRSRQAIAFSQPERLFSLRDVRERYPSGVHAKDSAWMTRRLLYALGLVHALGWVHGALTLNHILIEPENHGLVLVDWKTAVRPGERIADSHEARGRAGYAPEIEQGKAVGPPLDIWGAIHSIEAVTDGRTVPSALRDWWRGCTLESPRRRPQDALTLRDEYDELIGNLWGARKFRPFTMG